MVGASNKHQDLRKGASSLPFDKLRTNGSTVSMSHLSRHLCRNDWNRVLWPPPHPGDIIEGLARLAERNSLAAIHRGKGVTEETVVAWLRLAARHGERIEAILLANYRLTRAQRDALWTYVGHKREKGGARSRTIAAPSGAASPWLVLRV
jgi:hypothetical protein